MNVDSLDILCTTTPPRPLFKDLLVCLFKRQGDRDQEIFHQLIDSPNGCNGWDRARPKPGAQNSIWTFQGGGRGPGTLTHIPAFPGSFVGVLDQKWSRWELNWCSKGLMVSQAAAFTLHHSPRFLSTTPSWPCTGCCGQTQVHAESLEEQHLISVAQTLRGGQKRNCKETEPEE